MDGTWDEYALLDEIAKTVSEARRRKEVEFLRRCPQSIVSRCWAALDCEDWDDCAANILLDRGRALWEAGEIGGALDLKRLFEMAFRTRLEIAQTAMSELTDRPRNLFMKKAREKGLTQNAIHANVVGAVADSCYHDTADADSHFMGACVLLFYRVMLLDAEPTGFAAAGCAIAEAFGFYRAGQINAARDTLLFALPIMELIEPRTDWQRAAIAATYVFRTGLAAKTAEDLEMVEKLMQLAARLFEPKGNDYARCLYYLSEAAGKSGRLGEQLRLLKRILEVPNIRDDELLQIARTGVSVCRAELEGRPELFDLGDNDARGIPKELALLSKEFAVKAMSGINPTSEEERRYAKPSLIGRNTAKHKAIEPGHFGRP